MKRLIPALFAMTILGISPAASAEHSWQPGFIVLAEDRFDPAIQRLIAEHSLRSLPLERGRMFYLYPASMDPRIEAMQIRYLEALLEKRAAREAADEPDASTP